MGFFCESMMPAKGLSMEMGFFCESVTPIRRVSIINFKPTTQTTNRDIKAGLPSLNVHAASNLLHHCYQYLFKTAWPGGRCLAKIVKKKYIKKSCGLSSMFQNVN